VSEPEHDFERDRVDMVASQLRARGIRDERVLAAMAAVPREQFVPEGWQRDAYADQPLPIGAAQTISQPYVVARMAELAAIGPKDRVLDIGFGSGYQTAVLAHLAAEVHGVEIRRELADQATARLAALGLGGRVHLRVGDGGYGWPDKAPFDAILVAAAAEKLPAPLLAQLADGGRLVLPVGGPGQQELTRITRRGDDFRREHLGAVRFVAFMGDYGERLAPGDN
jgi:protein-L-isoaspartate(D-aspartate) O-methyltransferase